MVSTISAAEKLLAKIQTGVTEENCLEKFRQIGTEKFLKSEFPSKKEEDWRFTDLSALRKYEYEIAEPLKVEAEEIEPFLLTESQADRLVFVNDSYQPQLSKNSSKGVYVGNFAGFSEPEKVTDYLGQDFWDLNYFTALNKAGMKDLAIIWVKANIEVPEVIQLLFLSSGNEKPSLRQPHILIVAEKNSKVQLVETYQALDDEKIYWTNSVSQIFLEENASLEHTRIQWEGKKSFHLAKTTVQQKRDSQYKIVEINLGAQLSRHNLDILQLGEQTETRLSGLSLGQDEQITDTHTKVGLRHPYGTVDQLQKSILDDRAQAVFNGKIIVPQAAQMTNAAQLNRNLLLSAGAQVNTKPELEITADNVKCSHGATVAQLEEEEIFYLRSRGLTLTECRHLLVEAFAAEIINQVRYPSLRKRLFTHIK